MVDQKGQLSNPRSDLNRAVDLITGSLDEIGYVLGSGRVPVGPRRRRRVVRQLTPADVDQLVTVYQSGSSVPVVAEQFGVHWSTVLKHLEKRGVPRRGGHTRKLSDKQVEELKAGRAIGLSYRELASKYGVSKKTVRKEVKRR